LYQGHAAAHYQKYECGNERCALCLDTVEITFHDALLSCGVERMISIGAASVLFLLKPALFLNKPAIHLNKRAVLV
jgi:hypothetical protein